MKKDIILALSSDIFCKRWGSNLIPLLRSHRADAELIARPASLDLWRKALTDGPCTAVHILEIAEVGEPHGLRLTPH